MKNEMKNPFNAFALLDNNGREIAIGNRSASQPNGRLGDAIRRISDGKVFRVANLHRGLVTLANANGSKPSTGRYCEETDFSARYVFDCAAW
jgi:hypothetical protein